ncbi:hypothetical protein Tco_0201207 [Tanacetum coccineum]
MRSRRSFTSFTASGDDSINMLTRELGKRSQALREVASSGIGVELVDMKDFDPNVEQNYDRAIESFNQVIVSGSS